VNSKKIILSKELQIKMLEYFLSTSIPRKVKQNLLLNKNLIGENKK